MPSRLLDSAIPGSWPFVSGGWFPVAGGQYPETGDQERVDREKPNYKTDKL
jgi:hypothetical protein